VSFNWVRGFAQVQWMFGMKLSKARRISGAIVSEIFSRA
jgi:hypothetical protein